MMEIHVGVKGQNVKVESETHLHLGVQGGGHDQVGQFIVVQSCSFRRALAAGLQQLQQGFHLHRHIETEDQEN